MYAIMVDPSDKIQIISDKLCKKVGFPKPPLLFLPLNMIHSKIYLDLDKSISNYDIHKGATIAFYFKMGSKFFLIVN